MHTLSLELRVIMTHEGCDEQTVLGALVDEARCATCGHAARVPAPRWSRALDAPLRYALDRPADDWYWSDDDEGDDVTLGIAYRWRPPTCSGCGSALRLDALGRGDLACACGAATPVRALPDPIETPELPRPAWLVGEAPARDAIWLVVRLPDAIGWAGKDLWGSIRGVAADRAGAPIVLWTDQDRGHLAKLALDGGILWQVDNLSFERHSYLLGSPVADEIAIVDPRTNNLQFVDARDGTLLRTLQGPAPEHEKRDEDGFRRREPQTIDVYDDRMRGLGIGPDGTISIVRDWYDGLPRSLRRFDRDGNPLRPWRRRPGFLAILFSNSEDARPDWQRVRDRPLDVPGSTDAFGIARDGSLLVAGRESGTSFLVRWRADGRLDDTWQLPDWCVSVQAIAGDAHGSIVLLCDREGDPRQRVVARREGGDLRVLGGPWTNGEQHLHVCDDGAIVVAGDGRSLRILEPDGRTRWRSRVCIREDRARAAATSSC